MINNEVVVIKDSRRITDFFKGIAILLVILVHSHQRFDLSYAQSAIQRFGQMGCQIFFALSAFGLCHSFSRKPLPWTSYMKKRISGLAIGWWGAIFLHVVYRILMAIVMQKNIVEEINVPGVVINALFLNGFVPVNGINNTIVRGGWYIGTTVILYAFFPLLHKIYFSNKNVFWKRYRPLIFPTVILAITTILVIGLEKIHPVFVCTNNSFVYFSFINQLTPFSIGLVLFDISNSDKTSKYAPFFSICFATLSIILFYGRWHYSFVFSPSLVAASFLLLCWPMLSCPKSFNCFNNDKNIVIKAIREIGKISFPIYLTHTFIVYDFSAVCLKFLLPIYNNNFLWYIILLPIEFCLVVLVGYAYNKSISFIEKIKRR